MGPTAKERAGERRRGAGELRVGRGVAS